MSRLDLQRLLGVEPIRILVVQSLSHVLGTSYKYQSHRDIKKIISEYCEVMHQQIGQPKRNENFQKRITHQD